MCDKKNLWNSAGKAGLVLGLISIAYLAYSQFTATFSTEKTSIAFLVSVLNFIIWAAKFAGCILVMKMLMKKFAASEPEADHSDTMKWGMATALMSALIYSAAYLAYILFINPDTFKEAFDLAMESYSSLLDSNALQTMDEMSGKLPSITFFSNLIYCFLFGTVLSSILSRNIPSNNPFENQ